MDTGRISVQGKLRDTVDDPFFLRSFTKILSKVQFPRLGARTDVF